MRTIQYCGVTALFGIFLETNKHQNLTRLRHPGYKRTSEISINLGTYFTPTLKQVQHVLRSWIIQGHYNVCRASNEHMKNQQALLSLTHDEKQ